MGEFHWVRCFVYFFFFDAFSGGVTMDEGFEPLESDRFLFSGTLSASFFFFSLAIVTPYVCKYMDEIVMWPIYEVS